MFAISASEHDALVYLGLAFIRAPITSVQVQSAFNVHLHSFYFKPCIRVVTVIALSSKVKFNAVIEYIT